ncbi:C-terminal-binding protein 2 [Plecturocebus cupreus]
MAPVDKHKVKRQQLDRICDGICPQVLNAPGTPPLVALLDHRKCIVEMPILKDLATVAFCDAQSVQEIHQKVLNEALCTMTYHKITFTMEDLEQFNVLRVIVRLGSGQDNPRKKHPTPPSATSAICTRGTVAVRGTVGRHAGTDCGADLRGGSGAGHIPGKTLGLIRFGHTEQTVVVQPKTFGFRWNKACLGLQRVCALQDLVHQSDCLSLHCNFNEHNHNLANDFTIKQMRQGELLVNAACHAWWMRKL